MNVPPYKSAKSAAAPSPYVCFLRVAVGGENRIVLSIEGRAYGTLALCVQNRLATLDQSKTTDSPCHIAVNV